MEENNINNEPKKKTNKVAIIIACVFGGGFLLVMLLPLIFNFFVYNNVKQRIIEQTEEVTKEEEKKKDTLNADEKDSNGTLTQSSLEKINPVTIDESLSSVGIKNENDYSGVDLLQNPNFKFAFAFFFGKVEYADYYVEDSSVEDYESCGIAISFDNYKKVYKNIYGEEYTSNTIPNGTDFRMTDNGIWGCIITGYGEPVYFERESNKSGEYLASIKALEDEAGYVTTGRMKINYNNQKDGLLSIKELRITYND